LTEKIISVTGSTGFIGSHLVKTLKKNNHIVKEVSISTGIDLSQKDSIEKMGYFDVIVHLAAKSFVPYSFENPLDFYQNNIISTLNVLEAARLNNAKVVFISSYLYGPPKENPINESHALNPHNPYAQSKLICESLCEGYYRDFNLPVIILRPFNIYGPGQKEPFLIPSIISQARQGKIVLNDERPKRDYIHVYDIVSAIVKSIEKDGSELLKINLGTGESYSVEEVVNIVNNIYGNNLDVTYLKKYRQGEVLNTVANMNLAKMELGWLPKVKIENGLKEIISMG
jgi:nucleoside-diphosphate-sugar epimerase